MSHLNARKCKRFKTKEDFPFIPFFSLEGIYLRLDLVLEIYANQFIFHQIMPHLHILI